MPPAMKQFWMYIAPIPALVLPFRTTRWRGNLHCITRMRVSTPVYADRMIHRLESGAENIHLINTPLLTEV